MKSKLMLIIVILLVTLSACAPVTAAVEPTKVEPVMPTEVLEKATIIPTTAPEPVHLKVTMNNNISYAPLIIAQEEGFFKEYGIDVEFVTFNKSSEAVALFISGNIDVYAGTINSGFINSVFKSKDIKVVADRGHYKAGDKCTYQAIVVRKDLFESGKVTGPKDLKGLVVSSKPTGIHAFLWDTYLKNAGLSIDDLTINDLPDNVILDSLDNKSVDAMIDTEPTLSMVINSGKAVILAKAEDITSPVQTGIIAFGPKMLTDNTNLGARFLAAYLKAIKQYNLGKTERNLEIIQRATNEDMEVLKTSCWPQIRDDGKVDYKGIENFQNWSVARGEIDQPVPEQQLLDDSYLDSAQKLILP